MNDRKKRMNIVFLGSVTDEEKISGLSGASIAGNKMQLRIISALKQQLDGEITVVSVPSVAAYPRDAKLIYKRKDSTLSNGCRLIEVPFLNIHLIKQICQMSNVYHITKRTTPKDDSVILAFNLYPQVGNALVKLKKKGYRTAAILADLPIDDNSGAKHCLVQMMNRMTERNIRKENNLIVLNENAIMKYHSDASYIVMEGGCDSSIEISEQPDKTGEMNIVFSGRLIEYNGLNQLIDAMSIVEADNVFLDIYGSGPMEEKVKEAASANSRIRFFGFVDNKKMMDIQKRAWLLINPRPVNDPISKVTFPSKMFEYLVSGTPVLTTKLSCFSSEFDNLMFFCPSDSAKGIAEGINKLVRMSPNELSKRAEYAKSYIQKEKNWNSQASRMIRFLRGI